MQHLIFCTATWLLLIVSISSVGQAPFPTLNELIDSAIKKDYNLDNQELEIELTRLDRQKLKNAYLPRVKMEGLDGLSLTSVSVRTKEIQIPQLNIDISEGRNRYTATANIVTLNTTASMLLYSGGKIPLLKKAVDEKRKGQEHLTEKQKQDIISDVISTYDQLALLKQVRIVLDESEKRLAENLKTADKAFSYGLITNYERQKIEVAQAQVASRIKDYEGKLAIVQEKLYWLTNIPVERIALINNELKRLENVIGSEDVDNKPELKALDNFITAQSYKIKAEGRWFVPKIATAASLNYTGLLFGHLQSSKAVIGNTKLSTQLPGVHISPLTAVGIGFTWDLFDGKDGRHEVEKAIVERRIIENQRKDYTEKFRLNLTKCKSEYSVALSLVNVMEKQKTTATNALTQATKEYKTGLIKSSQLIDAEEDFENAALGLIQSLYNQRRTAIELLKATGSLTAATVN